MGKFKKFTVFKFGNTPTLVATESRINFKPDIEDAAKARIDWEIGIVVFEGETYTGRRQ